MLTDLFEDCYEHCTCLSF